MPGTEITTVDSYRSASIDERQRYAVMIAGAGSLLSQSVRSGGAAAVFLMAETGAMLGIHPVAALQGVHVIDGKPTLSANLLAALVHRAGHKLRVRTTGSWTDGSFKATATLIRADDEDFPFEVVWDKGRAERAGLVGKRGPWSTYPEAMCKARAITEVIREGAPDVTLVPAYTPEELGARVDDNGEVIELNQVPGDGPGVSRETPTKTRTAAPIVDEPTEPTEAAPTGGTEGDTPAEEFNWQDAIENALTADEVRALWRRARDEGMLDHDVKNGKVKRKLGPFLVEIGKKLEAAEIEQDAADAEAAVIAEAEAEEAARAAATPNEDVVDAEVVDEGQS